MNYRESLGKRLADERKRLGMTQSQLADACGIAHSTQYLYERGDRSPNPDYLHIAKELGMNIFYVLEGPGNITPIPAKELRRLYVKIDQQCRDSNGVLSDLEARADAFERIVIKYYKHLSLGTDV